MRWAGVKKTQWHSAISHHDLRYIQEDYEMIDEVARHTVKKLHKFKHLYRMIYRSAYDLQGLQGKIQSQQAEGFVL